jgi:hypothetical protein
LSGKGFFLLVLGKVLSAQSDFERALQKTAVIMTASHELIEPAHSAKILCHSLIGFLCGSTSGCIISTFESEKIR